jgi:hypothetical protein
MKKSTTTAAIATTVSTAIAKGATKVTLFYVETPTGMLYAVKAGDFKAVQAKPALLADLVALKHNPTCVYVDKTSLQRVSTDEARPMVYLKGGKFTIQPIAVEQVKVEKKVAGGTKTIRVANDGPQTIYVRLGSDATRPVSMTPEAFANLAKPADALVAIKFLTPLKHNPTCVMSALGRGLVSTEANRPMYELNLKTGKVSRVWATEAEEKAAAKVDAPKATKPAKVVAEAAPVAETTTEA